MMKELKAAVYSSGRQNSWPEWTVGLYAAVTKEPSSYHNSIQTDPAYSHCSMVPKNVLHFIQLFIGA